jgi:4-hydroxy-2-oxoheptanedioate aldolase
MTIDPSGSVRSARALLRRRMAGGEQLVGTFIKFSSPDVIDMCRGLDFVVIDTEHSTLSEQDAIALVRHSAAIGLPALVRVPHVDPAMINRLLEQGAVGIQLSMLRSSAQAQALRAACHYAPSGARSVSLSHPTGGFGQVALADYLERERLDPPLLVGQIESATDDPIEQVVAGLDLAFIGTTDLSVACGLSAADGSLASAVAEIAAQAASAGVPLGGWSPSHAQVQAQGLGEAAMVVLGSDAQILAAGIKQLLDNERR